MYHEYFFRRKNFKVVLQTNKLIQVVIFGCLISSAFSMIYFFYYNKLLINSENLVISPDNHPRSIFFLETSHIKKNEISLNARQCCAVESAAITNPMMSVYLLIFTDAEKYTENTEIYLTHLMKYKNIVIEHINIVEFLRNSPIQKWWNKTDIFKISQWPIPHISDILRLVTLWKYGGIYFDTDVIVKSSFNEIRNFAGIESSNLVTNSIFGLDKTGIGSVIADKCLQDLMENFRGDIWNHNGPALITRVLKKLCQTENVELMTPEQCHGFKLLPASKLHPIPSFHWQRYFEVDSNYENTTAAIDEALTIHVWNKFSASKIIKVSSNAPYALMASKYCPQIYNNCGKTF